jgi:hypothetical protein
MQQSVDSRTARNFETGAKQETVHVRLRLNSARKHASIFPTTFVLFLMAKSICVLTSSNHEIRMAGQ